MIGQIFNYLQAKCKYFKTTFIRYSPSVRREEDACVLDSAPNAIKIGVCCVPTILRVHSKWSKNNFALDMSKYIETSFIFNSG